MLRTLTLLVSVLGSAGALAAEAKLAVDFDSATGSAQWYAAGLEQLVAKEASRFSRVAIADKVDVTGCPAREPDCVVQRYTAAGIDVVVLGTLDGDTLGYRVYETWTQNQVSRGSLSVGGQNVSSRRVQHQIAELVRPIVSSGGLLDKRPTVRPEGSKGVAATAAARELSPAGRRALALFCGALVLLVLWPALLLVLLMGPKLLLAKGPRRTWRWTAALSGALLLSAAAALLGVGPFSLLPDRARDVLLPVLGGVLWGALALIHVGFVFPPMQGLSRIRHEALVPTLRAWVSLCGLRVGALVGWVPLFLLTLLAAGAAELPSSVTFNVVVPAVGLIGCFWLASLTEHLSVWLDERLVDGPAGARNAWHATVRKYFLGYLKRSGIVLDRDFIEQALFLPGKPDSGFEVHSWGGALGAPRILIGAAAIKEALGELPDEPEVPERSANPEELPEGFVVPADDDSPGATTVRSERFRKSLTRAAPKARAAGMPRLLGEPTTALGWVMPQPVDEALPLISNTREDYEVVKSLLTEHYGRFEKNLDEEDHDDTDPSQKDFLFGPLMVAAGGFTRRESPGATLALALSLARPHASWLSKRLLRWAIALYARLLAWPRAAVSDAFAALNQALHPLMQHLHLSRGGDASVITARADTPLLIETSKTLLEQLIATPAAGADAHLMRASARNRMLWLAPFFAARLAPPWPRWLRTLSLAAALVLTLAVVVGQVQQAVSYRPTYVERMTQMRAMADQAAQGAPTK